MRTAPPTGQQEHLLNCLARYFIQRGIQRGDEALGMLGRMGNKRGEAWANDMRRRIRQQEQLMKRGNGNERRW